MYPVEKTGQWRERRMKPVARKNYIQVTVSKVNESIKFWLIPILEAQPHSCSAFQ